MYVTGRRARDARGEYGFSLLEVVVAAGILLLTVTAVSASVTNASRADARLEATMQAQRAVRSVLGRLSVLPFCATALPHSASPAAEATDLLAAAFPHANTARNAATARYVTASEGAIPAGSFVTRYEEAGVAVTCVSRFRSSQDGNWLTPDHLLGWDAETSIVPPAPVLEIEIGCATPGGSWSRRLVRTALQSPALDSSGLPAP